MGYDRVTCFCSPTKLTGEDRIEKDMKLTIAQINDVIRAADLFDKMFPSSDGAAFPLPSIIQLNVAKADRAELFALARAFGNIRRVADELRKIEVKVG